MTKEIDLQLTGIIGWKDMRNVMIKMLKKASTEEDFLHIMKAVLFASSDSEEEMQSKRRSLGLPET